MRQILPSVAAIVTVMSAAPALAWNDFGHNLSAAIAYNDLKPEAKARVNDILKHHPQYDRLSGGCPATFDKDQWVFMKAATWPDMVRATGNPYYKTDHHPRWHYINLPLELDGVKGKAPSMEWNPTRDPENAVQALAKAEADLKDPKMSDADKAKSLSWFLHLGGDLHQPLHATNLYSKQFPTGDLGGNSFWVINDVGTPVNIHGLWDNAMGTSKVMKDIIDKAKALVAEKELTRTALAAKVAKTGYGEWARESADLCKIVVYREMTLQGARGSDKDKPKDAPKIPGGYQLKAEKVSEGQVTLAGYRMADKLNVVIGIK